MPVIQSHPITLYGGGQHRLVLRPLTDEHLPYLYRWCADPQVLYWTEGGTAETNLSYDQKMVQQIYGTVSKNALCFLVEAQGEPIGECWLQKMNLPQVQSRYPCGTDVRRIDMAIGEKHWWNKGVGTRMIALLADFAFCRERVDVLHCICEDYNKRSCRVWEKNGFTLSYTQPLLPQPQKGRMECHYTLTRQAYLQSRKLI